MTTGHQTQKQFKKRCKSSEKVERFSGLMKSSAPLRGSREGFIFPFPTLQTPRPSPFPSSGLQPSPERGLTFPPLTSLRPLR